ncbi:hypothetical protein WDZ17_02390 [Pseudokineococcus basanitobsidens]|uniref:EF-hand domain-containing protein n=1 Tax=Pseudokineococcus basanitobsidens TaxID=1926649 RepID=A0ABU8RGE4_9ACTN
MTRRLALGALGALLLALGLAAPAQAHPLGNFTVSQYDGLVLRPDRVDVLSVVDTAEIPTQQQLPDVDTDGDGQMSADELAAAATGECPDVAAAAELATADGGATPLEVSSASMTVVPGAASLPTLRLVCELTAPVDLGAATTVSFSQGYRTDRVGWREITATGEGVSLEDPPVPAESVSEELRSYPRDLLSSPLDVRSVELSVVPGGPGGGGALEVLSSGGDPFSRLVAAGDARLESFVGARELTPVVGVLAVVLAALLGAGHAVLPGHGKTVMAAYLAGRRGRRRDALLVGGTVTLTHTVGVLVVGLVLTVASTLAGEQVLRSLGVVSGLLVMAVGAVLVRDALRERRAAPTLDAEVHAALHEEQARRGTPGVLVAPAAAHAAEGRTSAATLPPEPDVDHGHGHGHPHGPHGHAHGPHGHAHGPHGHTHGPHGHTHGPGEGFSRRSLVGIGVAGGLVPSPSALVVLLGAVALGRSVFGVLLVLAYGAGMAGTLTAVGLLLVHARGRLDRAGRSVRAPRSLARLREVLPLATAALVVAVGAGLVLRGLLL